MLEIIAVHLLNVTHPSSWLVSIQSQTRPSQDALETRPRPIKKPDVEPRTVPGCLQPYFGDSCSMVHGASPHPGWVRANVQKEFKELVSHTRYGGILQTGARWSAVFRVNSRVGQARRQEKEQ